MIVITGASKGIGKYLCEAYSQKNIEVFGVYNNTTPDNNKVKYTKIDTTDENAVQEWVAEYSESLKDITLVNCAGINYNSFAHKADIKDWQKVVEVNLFGTFNMIRALLPLMREQSYGRIINFGSVVAQLPSPGVSAYAASKSALAGLSKSLAIENASRSITINNINLGYSELGMIAEVPEKFLQEIIERIPSKSLCSAEDIFNTVEYLRNTSYVNGSDININGGII